MQLGNMQWGTLEYIFAIFAIATAVGVLLQAGIMLGFFIAFLKLQGKIATILTQITDHAMPLIASSKVTLEELSPKVQTISTNLVEISELLKQETHTVKTSVDEVLERTRAQTARVDEMVSGTLDGISQASTTIQQGIEIPLRHVHGIFNGLKAAFQTYKDQPTRPVSPFAEVEEPVVVVVEEVIVAKANT
jgi:polyhydroxyalkanoate synthesis regulator phasin